MQGACCPQISDLTDMATIETLLSRTSKQDECLVWTGYVPKCGYGLVWHQGKNQQVHRVSYVLHKGEIPAGFKVLHSCDNRICINPNHLSVGTSKDNSDDMTAKGRSKHASGKDHHYSKLTKEIANEIKGRYKPYSRADGSLALSREFGVSQAAIYAVISGRTWK